MGQFWKTVIVALCIVLAGGLAFAREQLSVDLPVLLLADEINYDQELGTVVARGKVEIAQR